MRPAIFEFRDRRDLYFPFLGTSGDVPITPLYEYFPVGFRSLQRYLGERDHDVKIINLSTLLLCYPDLELATIARALDVPIVGIDLHWMVHVQGSLAVAEQIKRERPDIKILFGGISSTYYADELIRYPFIDMVMRGYDTHVPVDGLLRARGDEPALHQVPNLLWKDRAGSVVDNGYVHKPDTMACGIDWTHRTARAGGKGQLRDPRVPLGPERRLRLQLRLVRRQPRGVPADQPPQEHDDPQAARSGRATSSSRCAACRRRTTITSTRSARTTRPARDSRI